MRLWINLFLLFVLTGLTGCIEQEVNIKLNADGSGRIEVLRNLSEMESGVLLLGEEEPVEFETLTRERTYLDSTSGSLRKVEHSIYSFDDLAAALPELENEIAMMPRFSVRDDQLVVFLCHEMNPYHGFSSRDETNSFYRLSIEFPAAPESDEGTVAGNRFEWSADHAELTEFQKSDIGTRFFECTVPAAAVNLELRPRLVEYKETSKKLQGMESEPKLISSMSIGIPILQSNPTDREGKNATLDLFIPVDLSALPLSYENLVVEEMVIDGQPVNAELESNPSGVFFGMDQWGRPAPGLPIKLRFGWNSNVLKTIDRIQVAVDAALPTRESNHLLEVESSNPTNDVLHFEGHPGKQLAILEIKHEYGQTAVLTVATNLEASELSMVYLDTLYGLRYPAKGMQWKTGRQVYGTLKEQAEALFGEDYSVVNIYFPHIPVTSFRLECSLIEEKTLTKRILLEEDIHVH